MAQNTNNRGRSPGRVRPAAPGCTVTGMVCPACGGVVVQQGFGRPRKFCSDECRFAYNDRRKLARRAAGDPAARVRAPTGNGDPVKKKRALELLAEGYDLRQVGIRVGLSPKTVAAIARGWQPVILQAPTQASDAGAA